MKIWDLPTRLYHWLQALLFVGLTITGFTGKGPHIYLGLTLFTLILWRIIWGFIGSDTSRFAQFLSSPKTTIRYFLGKEKSVKGHNPAGSWMVIALILGLFIQCISGLIVAGMFDHLPYAEVIISSNIFGIAVTIHRVFSRLLPALVVLHLLAILFYKLRAKSLVLAMITGIQRKATDDQEHSSLAFASNKRAFLVLVAVGLVTIAIVVQSQV
ncbi:cytochrome b/b6 domain-containing protein [Photobacterium toruni]|uniref:Cytochrome b/b6 domain-containing protein n=1 Tax=Photobacterium toruni TaxID=1935446 RepID=A0ABU6L1V0_9GAMM|nr:cytochrome b/b6 domain-containing protein [Photobacterium toruni]